MAQQEKRACLATALVFSLLWLAGCASSAPPIKKSVPEQQDRSSLSQFGKSDLDRMADVQMRENTQSLRLLMTKLYKRNPRELRKSTSGTAEEMVDWVFEGGQGWRFPKINNVQGTEAIQLAFQPEYQGDRVLPFIVGLETMLIKAHGGKEEFFYTDSLDPQSIYNAARNVEIAAWKLSNARDSQGQLYLLTNELNDSGHNLSFEREFGKIIGRTDLYAMTLSEKSQRTISRIALSFATALFLPF
ncbi:uncharacterized protein NMK_1714 [Novimethylophilus kurashikiensis]|uniref:Lipoprotein n=1 Tax=Novimethylophilus kurashikiensis TaxID=1825523 RepID=A0A2R5FBZ1_9PROT|nr:hypothetical protein [Novimethylophilus kurashikiensis]GBG14154.1 uncharacterized protein NMK_1714 [Novimethylophilus kurashikiensis]